MKENCYNESTIQAFLDGELSSDMLENVARHVALCGDCALLLNEAEEESAFAFDILGEEFNTLVPTERIRANVYQAISQFEQPKVSFWQKVFGFRVLSNPSMVAFASLLIVFGVFATVLSLKNDEPKYDVAVNSTQRSEIEIQIPNNNPPSITTVSETNKPKSIPVIEKVVYKPETKVQNPKSKIQSQKPKTEDQKPKAEAPILEGEDTYLKTIATLETTVNSKKDNVLRASSRVSYEKDMAVIDDSIKRMKMEVRKNPKNEAAKQILRNSYQNKIELLNSVTERSELMARLD
jgi:hypothetical protein